MCEGEVLCSGRQSLPSQEQEKLLEPFALLDLEYSGGMDSQAGDLAGIFKETWSRKVASAT